MVRFSLGQVVATPGILAAAETARDDVQKYLSQHAKGEWGESCREDRQANDDAVSNGGRLFSVYRMIDQTKIWIITEADRSVTTILLPEEY